MSGLVFKWILKNGGIQTFHENNTKKSELLYETIETSGGFFKPIVNPGSRSRVNVVFRVGSDASWRRNLLKKLNGKDCMDLVDTGIMFCFFLKTFLLKFVKMV